MLSATGRLSPYGDVRKRLFETLHFMKVVVLGSLSDIKEACMRVRLLHAAIRYHLCHREGGWEVGKVSASTFSFWASSFPFSLSQWAKDLIRQVVRQLHH